MTVANRMAIGDVNGDGTVNVDDLAVDDKGNPQAGSLTVSGSLGIGTASPAAKLEIVDGGAKIKFKRELGNFGADEYTYLKSGRLSDTCDGDGTKAYECRPEEIKSKCMDAYNCSSGGCNLRWVTCRQEYGIVAEYEYEVHGP